MIEILRPGTSCYVGSTEKQEMLGTIRQAAIEINDTVSYQISWWNGRLLHVEWFPDCQVKRYGGIYSKTRKVGFAQ